MAESDSKSYQTFPHVGMALDPIHVGTGGARLGRVDLTIVRDPVTRVPKIPGSSLAGVYRTYAAMAKNRYPGCAGLGQPRPDGSGGHCGQPTCPICTVFGFARGRDNAGGFAGLAAFSDAQVLLFPVATREGPRWVTCPMALRSAGVEVSGVTETEHVLYREKDSQPPLDLGWLVLSTKTLKDWQSVQGALKALGIPSEIIGSLCVVSNRLFGHVVSSNLEVRTSVAIDPAAGAAEEGALFTYEALPRTTVLFWEVTIKNPRHFTVDSKPVAFKGNGQTATIDDVYEIAAAAHPYLEYLGIGGMGTRGWDGSEFSPDRVLISRRPSRANRLPSQSRRRRRDDGEPGSPVCRAGQATG